MKKELLLLIGLLSMSMTFAMAEEKETMVTLYNSDTTLSGGGSTIAVLRQIPRKVELFSCQKRYTGELKDFEAVKAFFNESHPVLNKRTNCLKYDQVASSEFSVAKRAILNEKSTPLRYVYSGTGGFSTFNKIASDVTTWTIDVNDEHGISSQSEVLLIGARVNHRDTDNPTISSYRDTYRLSGIGLINYQTIE